MAATLMLDIYIILFVCFQHNLKIHGALFGEVVKVEWFFYRFQVQSTTTGFFLVSYYMDSFNFIFKCSSILGYLIGIFLFLYHVIGMSIA